MSIAPAARDLGLAALVKWAATDGLLALIKPDRSASAETDAHVDQVTVRPPSPASVLWSVATLGLRTLAALTPALERSLQQSLRDPAPNALGHLARAAGDAAHQLGAGFAAVEADAAADLPTKPELKAWRDAARIEVKSAIDVLGRVGEHLQLEARHDAGTMDLNWAAISVAGAQRQLAATWSLLTAEPKPGVRTPIPAATAGPVLPLALAATGLLGTIVFLVVAALVLGATTTTLAAVGLLAAASWRWRIIVGARTVRLALRH